MVRCRLYPQSIFRGSDRRLKVQGIADRPSKESQKTIRRCFYRNFAEDPQRLRLSTVLLFRHWRLVSQSMDP